MINVLLRFQLLHFHVFLYVYLCDQSLIFNVICGVEKIYFLIWSQDCHDINYLGFSHLGHALFSEFCAVI